MHRFILLGLLGFGAAAASDAEVDALAVLSASDAIRNPHMPFAITVTLMEYRSGKQTANQTLRVYSKSAEKGGQFHTLIRFIAPPRDVNKLMLKNGNDLWFYDPAAKASVRVSPQQRLLGQAANGDVVTVNLAKDYHAVIDSQEEIEDGERRVRRCYKLRLTAASADVTYHYIEMWIDADNNRPVKGRFYTESRRLLKTAYYRRYQPELGVARPTETVIIDGLNPEWVTVMRYTDYTWQDVPDSWLQRDYLPHFKAK